MRSILIIRFTSLGDVVLATPLARQLQHTYPDAKIDVAVSERCADVWKSNPYIRSVWPVLMRSPTADTDAVKLSMTESLPDGTYDLIVDLQNNLRSRVFCKGLGKNVVRVNKHRLEKLSMVWLKRFPKVVTSIVSRYRKTVEHLPLAFDVDGAEVWLPEEKIDGAYGGHVSTTNVRHGRIAIAPGAHHATKRWPVERFAELCATLWNEKRIVPVLVGGTLDVPICSEIAAASNVPVERADGAETVESTIRTLQGCDALITNDSGVMHLGAARRLPVVAIYGSTVPALGFAPYGTRHVVIEHDVACRPCSHIGRSNCPRGHFMCMVSIEVDTVLDGLDRLGIFV